MPYSIEQFQADLSTLSQHKDEQRASEILKRMDELPQSECNKILREKITAIETKINSERSELHSISQSYESDHEPDVAGARWGDREQMVQELWRHQATARFRKAERREAQARANQAERDCAYKIQKLEEEKTFYERYLPETRFFCAVQENDLESVKKRLTSGALSEEHIIQGYKKALEKELDDASEFLKLIGGHIKSDGLFQAILEAEKSKRTAIREEVDAMLTKFQKQKTEEFYAKFKDVKALEQAVKSKDEETVRRFINAKQLKKDVICSAILSALDIDTLKSADELKSIRDNIAREDHPSITLLPQRYRRTFQEEVLKALGERIDHMEMIERQKAEREEILKLYEGAPTKALQIYRKICEIDRRSIELNAQRKMTRVAFDGVISERYKSHTPSYQEFHQQLKTDLETCLKLYPQKYQEFMQILQNT